MILYIATLLIFSLAIKMVVELSKIANYKYCRITSLVALPPHVEWESGNMALQKIVADCKLWASIAILKLYPQKLETEVKLMITTILGIAMWPMSPDYPLYVRG